jgi:hypothetical protein
LGQRVEREDESRQQQRRHHEPGERVHQLEREVGRGGWSPCLTLTVLDSTRTTAYASTGVLSSRM